MKIKFAIEEEIEVDDTLTDVEIDEMIKIKANGKDYLWTDETSLFDYNDY